MQEELALDVQRLWTRVTLLEGRVFEGDAAVSAGEALVQAIRHEVSECRRKKRRTPPALRRLAQAADQFEAVLIHTERTDQ